MRSAHTTMWVFLLGFFIYESFQPSYLHSQSAELTGIQCDLVPTKTADAFQFPLLPPGKKTWNLTNHFGRVWDGLPAGLPAGWWQHTGADYSLGQDSKGNRLSSEQPVYAAGNGVVVFSTKTNEINNPNNPADPHHLRRGGLVVIRHVAPTAKAYEHASYEKTDQYVFKKTRSPEFTTSYSAFQTTEVFTYYLHLDPDQILVNQGDLIDINQQIAKLYKSSDYKTDGTGRFAFAPHLHFEIWKTCGDNQLERNGYDRAGAEEFHTGVEQLLVNPVVFPKLVDLPSDCPTSFGPIGTVSFVCLVEGDPGLPGDGITVTAAGGNNPFYFELSPTISLAGITNGFTASVFGLGVTGTIQFALNVPGTQCTPAIGSGFDRDLIVNGTAGKADIQTQSILSTVFQGISSSPACTGTTIGDFVITGILINTGNGLMTEVDAIAIGSGQNALPQ